MSHIRLPAAMSPVFAELARVGAPHPSFTGRSLAYIANQLIEQSPCYIEAKTRLEQLPPKKVAKKS